MARQPAIPCDSTAPPAVDSFDVRPEERDEGPCIGRRVERYPESNLHTRLWLIDGPSPRSGRRSALVIERPDTPSSLDPHNRYQLLASRGRTRTCATGNVAREPEPGQLQFLDMTNEALSFDAGSGSAALYLARDVVDAHHPEASRLHGRVIRNASARVLAQMIRTVPDYFHQLSDDGADALADAFRLLALQTIANALADNAAEPSVDHRLLAPIMEHIRGRLSDRTLNPSTICEEFAISRATLYRLFAHEGGVARFIKRERLGAIHATLASGADSRQLMDIAHEFGFGSHSGFARSFRQQFGYPPSKVRPGKERAPGDTSPREASGALADREDPV